MKVRYIGPDIGVTGLTDGQIYEISEVEQETGALRVIDNDQNDFNYDNDCEWKPGYLYSPTKPKCAGLPYAGGRFIIIEDDEQETLKKAIKAE